MLRAFSSAPDMARQGDVTTRGEAGAYVAQLIEPGSGRHAFALTVDDELVGAVGITVDNLNRTGWFWYWIHATYRGRGWTSVAAATVADWALDAGGCQRLELGHRVNNPASGRVAEAAGFVREGRERAKFLVDEERIDVLTYGRLATDPVPSGARLPLRVACVTDEQAGTTDDAALSIALESPERLAREEVINLYDSVGWSAYTRDLASLMAGLSGSHRVVTARLGATLVGLARSVSDGHTIVYIQDVLVRPDAQRTGIGARLLTALVDEYPTVRQKVLLTDAEDHQRAFYESLGFTEIHDMRPEQRAFVLP